MSTPWARLRPRPRYAAPSVSAVRPTYHAATSVAGPDDALRPTIVAGSNSPATTFSALLFIAVLSVAAPRPRVARYTAATAFGRLGTPARMSPPTTISGIACRVPSLDAACSIATLAPTTTSTATAATTPSRARPRRG